LQHCYVLEPLPVPIIRLPGTTLSDVHPRNEIQVKNVQFLIGIGEMHRLNGVFCYTILGGKKWGYLPTRLTGTKGAFTTDKQQGKLAKL
jgi:hypothetical protein